MEKQHQEVHQEDEHLPEQAGLRQRDLPLNHPSLPLPQGGDFEGIRRGRPSLPLPQGGDLEGVRWLLAIAALLLTACAPPPLTGQDTNTNTADVTLPDAGIDTGRPDADPPADADTGIPFSQVADLLRNNCTKAGCHAANGNGNFAVEGGQSASEDVLADALRDTTVPDEDTLLVEPNKPLDSALYQVLVGSNGRLQMPLGGMLPDDEISVIERWIAQGAPYE